MGPNFTVLLRKPCKHRNGCTYILLAGHLPINRWPMRIFTQKYLWEGLSPYLSLGKIKAARLLGFSTKGQPSTLSSNPRLPHSTALVLILGIFPAVQLLPARRTPALFGLSSETVPPTTLATIKVDNKVQWIADFHGEKWTLSRPLTQSLTFVQGNLLSKLRLLINYRLLTHQFYCSS